MSEAAATNLPPKKKEEYKWEIRRALSKMKPNILKISKAPIYNYIKILPADNVIVTLLMEKVNYDNKINEISNGNYTILQKNSTTTLERNIYATL